MSKLTYNFFATFVNTEFQFITFSWVKENSSYSEVKEVLSYQKMKFEIEGSVAKRINVSSHSQEEDTGKVSQ